MPKALLDGVFAFTYGIAAWLAWWFVYMLGFGAVGPATVAVYVIGVPIASCFSLVLGTWRGAEASIPALCIGWALSLVITPATLGLANPANTTAADKLVPILILVSVLGIGVFGAITGVLYSRDRNRRRLIPLAVVTGILTGAMMLARLQWFPS